MRNVGKKDEKEENQYETEVGQQWFGKLHLPSVLFTARIETRTEIMTWEWGTSTNISSQIFNFKQGYIIRML